MSYAPKRGVSAGAGTTAALVALALLVTSMSAARGAQARTLYVRVAGDDANDGSTPALAIRHIKQAASVAQPGDRIVVGPGTYNEGEIQLAPAAFARVSFVADRRGTAVGEPPGDVVIDATGFPSGFELNRNLATTIDGFVITNAGVGIYVKTQSDQAVISNNVVANNTDNGIYIQDSKNVLVFNNLVYQNARTGILISGAPGTRVINNTVYRNQNRGIFFTGITIGSPNGVVINNIVQSNVPAGIQVNASSHDGYVSAGNVSADNRFASGTPIDVTDIDRSDPTLMFVDPDMADFHLKQTAAGQEVTSPAVNAGTDRAVRLKLGRASTRSDGRPDRGRVDAGYHYGNFGPLPRRPELRLPYKPIYVSAANGSDANDGATPTTALHTVARAFRLAQPGNEVRLLGGTYREGELTLENSGTPGRDIRIHGVNGAAIDATICPCQADPMGCPCTRGILLTVRSDITIDGLEVMNAADSGIEVRNGSSAITIRRSRLHDNGRRGLYVNNAAGITLQSSAVDRNGSRGVQVEAGGLEIKRTSITRNPDSGLWALNGSTVTVSDSQFVDNPTAGMLADQSDVTVTGGTISGSKDGGARFTNGSTGTVARVDILNNADVGVQGISSVVTVSGGRVEGSQIGIQAFVDPVHRGSNQLTVTGTRACNNRGSGVDAQDTAVALTGVTLCANGQEGLRLSGGTGQILRTSMTQNLQRGLSVIAADQVTVQDAVVGDNGDSGIQIATTAASSIGGSVVYRNGNDGITILDSPSPQLWNNLVYGNHGSGMVITGDTTGSPSAQVLNNTIFGNANRGLLLGGNNDKPPSQGAQVLRNVFAGNTNPGLQVNPLSLPGYMGDYNLSIDRYVPLTLVGLHDVLTDPRLVAPEHDDFHLSPSSPGVDAGGIDVAAALLQGTTTRTDGLPDTGPVDLGYHYTP